jgi:hypothetical protein
MRGHVKLGEKLQLRDYLLVDPKQYRRTLANQMAAKIGQGAGDYSDFQNWSYWVSEAWRSGVGRIDPDDGGFLYSTTDTRFNKRMMLPPQPTPTGTISIAGSTAPFNAPGTINYTITVADGGTNTKVAIPYEADGTVTELWVMLQSGFGETEPFAYVYSGATEPTTLVASGSVTQQTVTKGYEWLRVSMASHTASSGTQYWLVLEPPTGNSFTVPCNSVTAGIGAMQVYTSGAWATAQQGTTDLYGFVMAPVPNMGPVTAAVEFNGTIYAGTSNGDVYKWDGVDDRWEQVGTTLDAGVTDMERWMGSLWVAVGPSDNAYKITTGNVVTQQAWAAEYFSVGFGYLWRSVANQVFYDEATDLSSWSTAITVGSSDYSIVGMAPLEDDMYVSTSQALWRIGAGDYVYGVTLWGYYDDTNGQGLINHQGSLYAPQGNTVWRISANTPLLNIWSREEPLPAGRAGVVKALAGTNRELLALIEPDDANGPPSVWSWNQEGWHFITQLPPGIGGSTLIYDANTQCVWVFDGTGFAWNVRVPLNIPVPQQDEAAVYAPTGWMETGVYYGNLKEIIKDFDSVTVLGDNLSDDNPVKVYWRTADTVTGNLVTEAGDALTTEDGESIIVETNPWSLLGTITASNQMLRWTDYDVRPNSIDLNLGLQLSTQDKTATPVVRAVIVRYHPTIADRWRWQLPLTVNTDQQMLDGTKNTYTWAQQMAHLTAMAQSIKPVIFEDLDGTQYEVKVVTSSDYVTKYEYYNAGPDIDSVVNLTLEQVTDTTFDG